VSDQGMTKEIRHFKERVIIKVIKAMMKEIARLLESIDSGSTYTVYIETAKLDGKMISISRITKTVHL